MPAVHLCDGGCGQIEGSEGPFVELGKIRPRRYCHGCSVAVLAVVDETDDLHTTLAKDWTEGLGAIRAAFHNEHPKALLPDE